MGDSFGRNLYIYTGPALTSAQLAAKYPNAMPGQRAYFTGGDVMECGDSGDWTLVSSGGAAHVYEGAVGASKNREFIGLNTTVTQLASWTAADAVNEVTIVPTNQASSNAPNAYMVVTFDALTSIVAAQWLAKPSATSDTVTSMRYRIPLDRPRTFSFPPGTYITDVWGVTEAAGAGAAPTVDGSVEAA